MNIENDIFKRTTVDYNKLVLFGFNKINNNYIYERKFFNDEFKAIINVDNSGKVTGKVIDLETEDEYILLRAENDGEFVNKVRMLYKDILIEIRNNCFNNNYFIFNQSNRIANYIKNKYNNEPEFLWDKFPFCGVFRNNNNKKWYGIIMNLDLSKLDNSSGEVEIINIKLGENKIKELLKKEGFYEAYHMSKKEWISILLNDTLSDDEIISLIDESYDLIDKKRNIK